jgi:hypothetical protein
MYIGGSQSEAGTGKKMQDIPKKKKKQENLN